VQAPLSQVPKIDIGESRDREKCFGGERRRQTEVGRREIEMVKQWAETRESNADKPVKLSLYSVDAYTAHSFRFEFSTSC